MQLVVVAKNFWAEDGTSAAATELTRELVKLGIDLVTVVHANPCVSSVHEPKPEKAPVFIDVKDNWFLRRPPFEQNLLSRKAAKLLKSMQNEFGRDCIIHSHSLFPSAFCGNNCEKKAAFVTTIHGTGEGERERCKKEMPLHPREISYRLGYNISSHMLTSYLKHGKGHFIALSPSNAREILRHGLPMSQIHIIPNGVDLKAFKPFDRNKARKRLNLPTEKSIVLTINAIDIRKGLHTLIKAAHSVVKDKPDAYFVVVGKAAPDTCWYLSCLKKLINKLSLNKYFKLTGFVPAEELPFYISASDVFTLASYAEGAPLVIPQAMACSRVVIATQGAAASYLPPSLVVQNGNVGELAQKISFYLLNEKDCRLMGKQLYEKALNEFSWSNIAKKTLSLYKQIIEQPGSTLCSQKCLEPDPQGI
jgi:glycosyltransferase involved in cell wall biosynthesis